MDIIYQKSFFIGTIKNVLNFSKQLKKNIHAKAGDFIAKLLRNLESF